MKRVNRTGLGLLVSLCAPVALGKQALTIRQAMETSRFMVADEQGRAVSISPDGCHYAAALVRGDVGRDGVEVEIVTGGLDTLEAAKPESVARLFTRGLGGEIFGPHSDGTKLVMSGANFPAWVDNEHVALLWEDERGVHQVNKINIRNRTHDAHDTLAYRCNNLRVTPGKTGLRSQATLVARQVRSVGT